MSRPVKKMAPPRPPPPSGSAPQQSQVGGPVPFQQQRNSQLSTGSDGQIDEGFRYRVGASVFYVKSELKNSGISNEQEVKIFSPPRPTAQSILTSSNKLNNTNLNAFSTSTTGGPVKYFSQPTIINTNSTKQQSQQQQQQQQSGSNNKYENVNKILLDWDEPPAVVLKPSTFSTNHQQISSTTIATTNINIKPQILGPKPTIIKPKPTFKPQSTQPQPPPTTATAKLYTSTTTTTTFQKQHEEVDNYAFDSSRSFYDDGDGDDSFVSPPMPSMPPPPPPPDIQYDQESDFNQNYNYQTGTTGTAGGSGDGYSETGNDNYDDNNRPYAIVLYDFQPEAEGDLALQAGDLVYLTKSVDESWLVGVCEGVEGMFPTNYVNVVVPLPPVVVELDPISYPPSSTTDLNYLESLEQKTRAEFGDSLQENTDINNYNEYKHYTEVLYDFTAENDSDLSLKTGDIVTLRARLNEDWLWGELNGNFGQFPAAFIQSVPNDIPYCQ